MDVNNFRSQSGTPRQGDETEKAPVVHFKDAILPASDDESEAAGLHDKLQASPTRVQITLHPLFLAEHKQT